MGSRLDPTPFLVQFLANFRNSISAKANRKARKGAAALRTLAKVPDSSFLAFTDGSAIPNPGPSGAGAWVSAPNSPPDFIYQALGPGTNNIGELWGIGMALKRYNDLGLSCQISIATDSEWSIGVLSKGWVAGTNLEMVARLIALITALPSPINFIWVQAHSGLERNDYADHGAKLGSKLSRARNLSRRGLSGGFTYRHWDGNAPPD
jgi:ribonuclease HI